MDAHAEEVERDLTEAQVTKVEGLESGETAGFGVVFGSAHFRVNSDELRADALDELDVMIQNWEPRPYPRSRRGGKQRQRGARQRACHAPNAAYRRAGVSRDGLRNNISNARRGVVLCQSPILHHDES